MGRHATYVSEADDIVRDRLGGLGFSKQYIYKLIKARYENKASTYQILLYNLALDGQLDVIEEAARQHGDLDLTHVPAEYETEVEQVGKSFHLMYHRTPSTFWFYWNELPDVHYESVADARRDMEMGNRLDTKVCVYQDREKRIVPSLGTFTSSNDKVDHIVPEGRRRARSKYGINHK